MRRPGALRAPDGGGAQPWKRGLHAEAQRRLVCAHVESSFWNRAKGTFASQLNKQGRPGDLRSPWWLCQDDPAAFNNYFSNKSDLNTPEEGGHRSWCRGPDRERGHRGGAAGGLRCWSASPCSVDPNLGDTCWSRIFTPDKAVARTPKSTSLCQQGPGSHGSFQNGVPLIKDRGSRGEGLQG